ncbi:MAG: type II secretion system protein [Elusimicrobia bacterium]|nr:type II secretion system protein [Elusimicrobiota bacterium]
MPGSAESRRGFTLVELMVVVAVVGTLAAIAVPRFAETIRLANEGATKGNLGILRSSLSVYYADMDGQYPSELTPLLTPGNKYLSQPLSAYTIIHDKTRTIDYVADPEDSDTGHWAYVNSGSNWGKMYIACTHSDTKGNLWSQY